jgi:hypothetical protein
MTLRVAVFAFIALVLTVNAATGHLVETAAGGFAAYLLWLVWPRRKH